ncbi:uncharacterized protein L201_002196 [Kwoniella dendrophila CBS 6074]|uniref:Uncharacterized protein n=1 Tax=Kwoniella dendrophila CBS 6074 TaxID=1295534 RepID=A0AAX4JPI0_9TREE
MTTTAAPLSGLVAATNINSTHAEGKNGNHVPTENTNARITKAHDHEYGNAEKKISNEVDTISRLKEEFEKQLKTEMRKYTSIETVDLFIKNAYQEGLKEGEHKIAERDDTIKQLEDKYKKEKNEFESRIVEKEDLIKKLKEEHEKEK